MSRPAFDAIEARADAATPGPWFHVRTDDESNMCADYVGTVDRGDRHDNRRGMAPGTPRFGEVVAITLIQTPLLAAHESDLFGENAAMIAHARTDIPALVAYARELEATLANERGTGPTPDGWYWADGQWNREADGGIYTVDRNPCPTDDDINCDCPWLPTTWTARFSRWDDEECKNTKVIGTYDTAREAIRAASVTP